MFVGWRLNDEPMPTAYLVEMLFDTHVGQPLLQERDEHAWRDLRQQNGAHDARQTASQQSITIIVS